MNHGRFAYHIHPQLHEVVMGTTEAMLQRFSSTITFHYCTNELELRQAIQPYRDREWILTALSELPVVFPPVITKPRLSCSGLLP